MESNGNRTDLNTRDEQQDPGILLRLFWVLEAVFVAFSFTLLAYFFSAIANNTALRELGTAEKRLIVSAIWLVLAAVVVIILRQKPLDDLRILHIRKKSQAVLLPLNCLLGFLIGVSLNRAVTVLVKVLPLPEAWVQGNSDSVASASQGNPVASVIALCIVAPVIEELAFRGKAFRFLEKAFTRGTMEPGKPSRAGVLVPAALITALLFAFAHDNILQCIYAFVCGLVFVWIAETAGSIVASVFAHIGFNLANLIFYTFFAAKETELTVNIVCFVLLAVCAVCVFITGRMLRGGGEEADSEPPSIYINN